MKKLPLTLSRVFCTLTMVVAAAGCAKSVGTIDRTQANLIDKSHFQDGAWYTRATVIDVPPTSSAAFVGLQGELEMIRWEIREDRLIGYRAYEFIPGADSNADHDNADIGSQPVAEGHGEGYDPSVYRDNPVVSYPITDHVDVQRDYNPRTGEQTNVIVENITDRPWHDRTFMRVDWANPLSGPALTSVGEAYWVDDHEQGSDSLHLERDENGRTVYFDITTRAWLDSYDCYYSYMGDCTPGEMKVRTSFLRVDEERERAYEPLDYDDRRMGEFGLFRTERPVYDRYRGLTQSKMLRLGNRYDVWQRGLDEDGKPIPFAERELRPIVYTLSANYPNSLMPITEELVKDYDETFKRAVATARGQSVKELTADLKSQTGDTCMFCLNTNEDSQARTGDIRTNFLFWVDNPQLSGPLGYGPSSANPENGRIVSGNAYVYGGAVDTYAERAADMVRTINGELSLEDLMSGDDVREQLSKRRAPIDPRRITDAAAIPLDQSARLILGEEAARRIDVIQREGLPHIRVPSRQSLLEKLEKEGLLEHLFSQEMRRDLASENHLANEADVSDEMLRDMAKTILNAGPGQKEQEAKRRFAEEHSIWLSDYNDPAVLGLAMHAKDKGLTGDALRLMLRDQIYKAVMLHELGHTVGLRHNFGSSADALNYHDEYWKLRQHTHVSLADATTSNEVALGLMRSACFVEDEANREGCLEQRRGRMSEYAYSSIMDYGGRFNADFQGLGRYDDAALAATYGDLVEVFDTAVTDELSEGFVDALRQVGDIKTPLLGTLNSNIHYTRFPELFGSAEAMSKRKWIAREEFEALADDPKGPVRVPYVACFDEYTDSRWFCRRWDSGADPMEINQTYIDTYENDYFFSNFARDRLEFRSTSPLNRALNRYFLPINSLYQASVFNLGRGDAPFQISTQLAMVGGFEHLWSVLARPSYGSYEEDGDAFARTSYSRGRGTFDIEPGAGRRPYSRYDVESGYFALNRPIEAGHMWEQFGALIALTNTDATRLGLGRDVVQGDVAYSLPYYLLFEEPLIKLFGSIFLRQPEKYAPYVVDGSLVDPGDYEAMKAADPTVEGRHIQMTQPWTIRFQSLVYGMAEFRSNFDLTFAQRNHVALVGSGEEITPAPGYEAAVLEDPVGGRVYAAYRKVGDEGTWPAAEKIDELNALVTELNAMPTGTREQKSAAEDLTRQISWQVEDLELMRGLYNIVGQAF